MLEKDAEREQEIRVLRKENDLQRKTIDKQVMIPFSHAEIDHKLSADIYRRNLSEHKKRN